MNKIAILAALAFPAFCMADTIIFKNGQELEGQLVEQDDTTILFKVEYGTLRISKDKVERVDPDTPEKLAKRDLESKAADTATAQPVAADTAQAQVKAKLAEAAKAAQAKAKAKTVATATKTTQQNQPSWADQYIQFRRTMHTDGAQGNSNMNGNFNSRARADRQSLLGTGNTGSSRSQGSTSRARMPDINQMPNGMSDLAKKYISGR